MIDGPSDSQVTEWALAAGLGDRAAQENFVRATQRDVWRFIVCLAGIASAEDLAQETYLRALRSLPKFAARSSARGWLLSIARRVVADQIRTAQVRPRQSHYPDWQGAAERVQPIGLPGFDDGLALRELLDSLADDRREAFVLTQLLGLSYAEAADVCGCPVGTIRSRVARAREDLIDMLTNTDSAEAGNSTAS